MNRLSVVAWGMLLGSVAATGEKPVETGPPEIVVHRTNPHVDEAAPVAGGTSAVSPIINHGGPIMTQANAYLIWYGNWNQTNGSDNPLGQGLVRTFLSAAACCRSRASAARLRHF